ncbi:MAG: hydrogenase maturation nickel metallochaperone HypA [Candidatus Eremiobacteraeota bacterium]|nr:hydrogenase maturation nickel metallochaperone HypA [Candidatus Eremiobacteraeota bacterium]
MHEMSIAMNIFRIVREKLKKMYGKYYPVKKVAVNIGKMSTVVPAALEFCFEMAGKDTIFEGAELEIVEIPLKIHCEDCKEDMILDEPFFFCRKCDSFNLKILSGKEMNVDTFEIDETADPITEEAMAWK